MSRTLEQIRNSAGKSRAEAAGVLGITESAYWRKENGKRGLTVKESQKLAALFLVEAAEVAFADRVCANSAQQIEEAGTHRPV